MLTCSQHRPRAVGALIAGLVASLLVADAAPPSPPPDPVAIYERCVAAMRDAARPPYAEYTLSIDAHHLDISRDFTSSGAATTILHFGSFTHVAALRLTYRERDQKTVVEDVIGKTSTVGPPLPWALDLTPPPAGIPSPADENVSGQAVDIAQATILISHIYIDEKDAYHITLAGVEEYAGHRVYHLTLQNVGGDPNEHPLRTLFVDAASYRPRQVTIEVGERTMMFGGDLTMSANFDQVGDYWLSTNGSIVGNGHFTFIHVHGTYTYSATDFAFPATLPDSIFTVSAVVSAHAAAA